ncbi:MAG: toprim domain-containing protein, partial [Planctomycetota bacterium]
HGGSGNAPCPVCQPDGRRDQRALAVSDSAGKLLMHCHRSGCDFRDILAALEGRGLPLTVTSPEPMRAALQVEAELRERRTAQARRLWAETVPAESTLVERYLRARRIKGPIPPSIRFAPDCWHASAVRAPAMVAAVMLDGFDEPVAVHRTYLAEPGRKAGFAPNKAMLGPVRGGAVRLSDGAGPIVVVEGIETGLSLAQYLALDRPRVWAALSASGVAGLRLPPDVDEVVPAPDGDDAGIDAAHKLGLRASRLGWRVRIMPPPGDGLDWNDWAMGASHEAA